MSAFTENKICVAIASECLWGACFLVPQWSPVIARIYNTARPNRGQLHGIPSSPVGNIFSEHTPHSKQPPGVSQHTAQLCLHSVLQRSSRVRPSRTCVGGELEGPAEVSVPRRCPGAHVEHIRGQGVEPLDVCVPGGRLHDAIAALVLVLPTPEHSRCEGKTAPCTGTCNPTALPKGSNSKGMLKKHPEGSCCWPCSIPPALSAAWGSEPAKKGGWGSRYDAHVSLIA